MSDRGYGDRYQFGVGDWSENCQCGLCCQPDTSPTPTDPNFVINVWDILDDIGNLMIDKQADYGPSNINNAHGGPINGLLVRIGDKFERLKNLYSSEDKPNFESIEDSFKDLANYAIIGLMVQRGKWPKNKEQ